MQHNDNPDTEGGAFLRQALLNDVIYPNIGYHPQQDAQDAPQRPQRATDPSAGHGDGQPMKSAGQKSREDFAQLLHDKLNTGISVNRLRRY